MPLDPLFLCVSLYLSVYLCLFFSLPMWHIRLLIGFVVVVKVSSNILKAALKPSAGHQFIHTGSYYKGCSETSREGSSLNSIQMIDPVEPENKQVCCFTGLERGYQVVDKKLFSCSASDGHRCLTYLTFVSESPMTGKAANVSGACWDPCRVSDWKHSCYLWLYPKWFFRVGCNCNPQSSQETFEIVIFNCIVDYMIGYEGLGIFRRTDMNSAYKIESWSWRYIYLLLHLFTCAV